MAGLHWSVYTFIALLAGLLYFNSLNGGYVWDDRAAIVNNQDISSLSVFITSNRWSQSKEILSNVVSNTPSIFDFLQHDFWGQNITKSDSHKSYRPITTFTYMIDHYIFSHTPFGYHFTNVLIFVLASIVMLALASQWLKPEGAFVSSLLFVCHPVHVEAVASLVGRADCLSGLFYLLALYLYTYCVQASSTAILPISLSSIALTSSTSTLSPTCSSNIIASVTVYLFYFIAAHLTALLSSFSKETGVTVYGVFVVVEVIELHRIIFIGGENPKSSSINTNIGNSSNNKVSHTSSGNNSQNTKTFNGKSATTTPQPTTNYSLYVLILFRILLSIIMVLLIGFWRLSLNGKNVLYNWTVLENHVHLLACFQSRALTYAQTHFWYFLKLLYPRHLSFDYGYACLPTIESIYDVRNIFPLISYSIILFLAYYSVLYKFTGSLILGLSLITLPLVPALNILFPIGTLLAERLLFVPSVGICMMLGRLLTLEAVVYWEWLARSIYIMSYGIDDNRSSDVANNISNDTVVTSSSNGTANGTANNNNHANNLTTVTPETTTATVNKNRVMVATKMQDIGQKYSGVVLLIFFLLPVCFLGSLRIITRNVLWKTENVLFSSALTLCPLSVKALSNHALIQMNEGKGIAIAIAEGVVVDSGSSISGVNTQSSTKSTTLKTINTGRAYLSILAGEVSATLYDTHTAALVNTALTYSHHLAHHSMHTLIQTTSSNDCSSSINDNNVKPEVQQYVHSIPKQSKPQLQSIRSLYTLNRAIIASNQTSAKAYGYAGNTLFSWLQSLPRSSSGTITATTDSENNNNNSGDNGVLTEKAGVMLRAIAINQIEASVLLGLESPTLLHTLGSLYLEQGDAEAAVYYLRYALTLSGSSGNEGRADNNSGNTTESISSATTPRPNRGMSMSFTTEDVKRANTYNQLGNALSQLGQHSAATAAYQTGLYYDSRLIALYVNLGSVCMNTGDYQLAREWLIKGLYQETGIIDEYVCRNDNSGNKSGDICNINNDNTDNNRNNNHNNITPSPALLNNLGLAELSLNMHTEAQHHFQWAMDILVQGDSNSSNQDEKQGGGLNSNGEGVLGGNEYMINTIRDNLIRATTTPTFS